jgi:arylsulfatase A-like enzyme
MTHWRLTGLLFDCYWVLGALTGSLAAVALGRWDRRRPARSEDPFDCGRLPGSLSLLAGVTANLIAASVAGHLGAAVLVISAALGALIVYVMNRPHSWLAPWVDFNPIVLALILISPMWVSTDGLEAFSFNTRVAGAAVALVALCIVNRMLRAVRRWPAHLHFVSGLGVLALMVLSCGFKSGDHKLRPTVRVPSQPDPQRPPVVFVSLDTTRADHTSVGGYSRNTTPNLVRFAAGATVYPNAVAAYDMTLASHASMFTGVYPSWHGATLMAGRPAPLDDRLPTLAGTLGKKGYFTAAVVANTAYLIPRWGLLRGFAYYDCQHAIKLLTGEWPFELRQGVRSLLSWFISTDDFDVVFRRGEEVNQAVFRTMSDTAVRDRSFLLFVNYMDAHTPYLPPEPYDSEFLGEQPLVPFAKYQEVSHHRGSFTRDEYARLAAQYDGGVAYEDHSFGQLMKWLKEHDLYDRALIIAVGDHGEALGERSGNLGHGLSSVHSEEMSVPLLIKYPHQTEGAVVSTPVSHVDLLPTILDTLDYEIPGHIQGRSLYRTETLNGREILGESQLSRALVYNGMKLIVHAGGQRELYDLAHDPEELQNLYPGGDQKAAPMEAAFRIWTQKIPGVRAQSPMDLRELRRLKSLGYLQ